MYYHLLTIVFDTDKDDQIYGVALLSAVGQLEKARSLFHCMWSDAYGLQVSVLWCIIK